MISPTCTTAPRTVHLYPRLTGWIAVWNGGFGSEKTYPDLGAALDATTRGPEQVHVVVHDRRS